MYKIYLVFYLIKYYNLNKIRSFIMNKKLDVVIALVVFLIVVILGIIIGYFLSKGVL